MSVRFNINDQVKIKLTEHGKEVFEKFYHNLGLVPEPYYEMYKRDFDDKLTMPLWEVMNIFGAACYNGCKIPFETEFEFK